MGSKQSTEMDSFVSSCMDVTTKVINENMSNNNITCTAMNDVTIRVTGNLVIGEGGLNIGQKANVEVCEISSSIQTQTNNDFETKILNSINSMMDNQQKSTSGFMSASFSDQSAVQRFRSEINTAISQTFQNQNMSICAVDAKAVNSSTVEITGNVSVLKGGVNITQDALVKATAQCIVDAVISNINKTVVDNVLTSSMTQSQTAEQRGPMESFGAMIATMQGPLIILAIIAVVGGIIYLYFSGGGQPSQNTQTPQTPNINSIQTLLQQLNMSNSPGQFQPRT